MHSPPDQPRARIRSGAGAVTIMSLVIATIARESSGMPAAQALVATTTRRAVTEPCSVAIRAGSRRSNDRTRVCSKIRTPAASAAFRSPRASAAGCTVAAESSITPARWKADPERRAISSGASLRKVPTPSFSQSATTPSHAPSCAAEVAVHSHPALRKCASIPRSAQNVPISSIAASDPRATRTASASPHRRTSEESLGHQERTNPPFLPDAPPPQMSCSSTTTSREGSSRLTFRAVHRPT